MPSPKDNATKSAKVTNAVVAVLDRRLREEPIKNLIQNVQTVQAEAAEMLGIGIAALSMYQTKLEPHHRHARWARLSAKRFAVPGIWFIIRELNQIGGYVPGWRSLPPDVASADEAERYANARPELRKPWTQAEVRQLFGIGEVAIKKLLKHGTLATGQPPVADFYMLPPLCQGKLRMLDEIIAHYAPEGAVAASAPVEGEDDDQDAATPCEAPDPFWGGFRKGVIWNTARVAEYQKRSLEICAIQHDNRLSGQEQWDRVREMHRALHRRLVEWGMDDSPVKPNPAFSKQNWNAAQHVTTDMEDYEDYDQEDDTDSGRHDAGQADFL